jgi:hypothetical protein
VSSRTCGFKSRLRHTVVYTREVGLDGDDLAVRVVGEADAEVGVDLGFGDGVSLGEHPQVVFEADDDGLDLGPGERRLEDGQPKVVVGGEPSASTSAIHPTMVDVGPP